MRQKLIVGSLAAAIVVVAVVGITWAQRSDPSNGEPLVVALRPDDATGHTWHHPDEVLFLLTRLGPEELVGAGYESDMPSYADILTDEEILSVLTYIKSQWPDEIQAQYDRINALAHDN